MVQEAAGYRFGDYWRLGLPLLLIYGLAGVFAVDLVAVLSRPLAGPPDPDGLRQAQPTADGGQGCSARVKVVSALAPRRW